MSADLPGIIILPPGGAGGGGGSGTPGGADTQVQFNDAGSFGGDPNFTFDKTTAVARLGAASSDFLEGMLVVGNTAPLTLAAFENGEVTVIATGTYDPGADTWTLVNENPLYIGPNPTNVPMAGFVNISVLGENVGAVRQEYALAVQALNTEEDVGVSVGALQVIHQAINAPARALDLTATYDGSDTLLDNPGLVALMSALSFTLSNATVAYGAHLYLGTPNNGGGSIITHQHGVWIQNQGIAGGTYAYGIKIENQTTATVPFALHTGAGYVRIGQRTGTPATMAAFDGDGILCETTLPTAGAPTSAQYVTLATDATLTAERVLTGTANQIGITDGGAGNPVTLALSSTLVAPGSATVTTRTGTPATFATFDSGGKLVEAATYAAPAPADPQYVVMAATAGLASERVLTAGNGITLTDAGAGAAATIAAVVGRLPGGRLTLTTGVPVTSADVTGATSIRYTPYVHDCIELWTGSLWSPTIFTEQTLALGTLASATIPNDVFGFLNAGALNIEKLAWTNATTRATALALTDGRYTKSGDKTRLYLGTFYPTATTTTEDSRAKRFVWNMYNRVRRSLLVQETTDSWTYATATWRQVRATGTNQVEAVNGLAESLVELVAGIQIKNDTIVIGGTTGIGFDSTTAPHADAINVRATAAGTTSNYFAITTSFLRLIPAAGYHAYTWLEIGGGSGTQTWFGDAGGTDRLHGMTGSIDA